MPTREAVVVQGRAVRPQYRYAPEVELVCPRFAGGTIGLVEGVGARKGGTSSLGNSPAFHLGVDQSTSISGFAGQSEIADLLGV